jgi:hypothetical protein
MQEAHVTREQLYELVWAEPVRTIAAQNGILDVALAKACRKIDVPLPERGYWAKLQAGKSVTKAKLRSGHLYTDIRARFFDKSKAKFALNLLYVTYRKTVTGIVKRQMTCRSRVGVRS